MKQKKTCGKNQHVRIDNIYRKANLICCRTDDAVEINLRYYIYITNGDDWGNDNGDEFGIEIKHSTFEWKWYWIFI